MSNYVAMATQQIKLALEKAVASGIAQNLLPDAPLPEFSVQIPSDTSHGDFAANIAMVCSKLFRLPPRGIAQILCDHLSLETTCLERVEIAGPGFLNFFLRPEWFVDVVDSINQEKEDYGKSDYGKGEKVMVEFVSANPTGPMHMGNARGGSVGDCLAAAMSYAGFDVHKEFYINDAGNQIEKFAISLETRYLQHFLGEDQVVLPEDAYQGEDIVVHAKNFAAIHGDRFVKADSTERKQAMVDYALPLNIENLRKDLERYRIVFDQWFPESQLHESGAVDAMVKLLTERGLTYEKEGAIWYQATKYGGEKDEVLVRANGIPTYFTADIAYHYNKFVTRGFQRCIDVWGADHHGHVARMKGSMDAVGLDGNKLDIILMQLVRLTRDGKPVKMSKRTGKAITLSDLLEEIPIDAARFFFNMREASSTLDFDLDLAVEESSKNPVYYVQYAHARICSILKNLQAEGITLVPATREQLLLLNTPEELELIRILSQLPHEIIAAARDYNPAGLTHYVLQVATIFHKFYTNCHVREQDRNLMVARIALCVATRHVIWNVLTMIKVDAPESM